MDRDRSFVRAALATMPKRKFRFHIMALTHLPVSDYYSGCAYTQKVRRLCRLIKDLGHTVFLYALEGSDASVCTEHIQTHTLAEVRSLWGDKDYDGPEELGYDWRTTRFRNDFDEPTWLTHKYINTSIGEIYKRRRDDDFLLVSMGRLHKPIADAVRLYLTCEPGIGYTGVFAPFLGFESTSQRDYVKGAQQGYEDNDGSNYHRVIPNYYYPEEFAYKPREQRGDYYLFIGRIIHRKGYGVAIDVAEHTGVRLLLAGQGVNEYDKETRVMVTDEGERRTLPPNVEYIGFADSKRRSELMSNAIAVFTPTLFREPFCGVAVEAQMCGTPVITSSYGAFAETVEQGRTGIRCHTINDYVVATRMVPTFDTEYIRDRAHAMFSAHNVALVYEKWLQDLYDVYESTQGKSLGWYQVHAPSAKQGATGATEPQEAAETTVDGRRLVTASTSESADNEREIDGNRRNSATPATATTTTTKPRQGGGAMRRRGKGGAPAAAPATAPAAAPAVATSAAQKAKDNATPKPRIAPDSTTMVPKCASGSGSSMRKRAFAGRPRRVGFA